jgi:hypothetical protein
LVLKREITVALSIPRITLAEQSRNDLIKLDSNFIVQGEAYRISYLVLPRYAFFFVLNLR